MSRWFSLRLNTDSQLEISIFDVIGGDGDCEDIDCQSVADLINVIRECADKSILLYINSPGGDVFDGYALYNVLAAHPKPVSVEIIGVAGSIASYIAMAGGTVKMCENSLFMIHNPSLDACGDAEDLRQRADLLDKCKASIVAAYQRKTKIPEAQLSAMLDATTILSAEEALGFGFVDSITQPLLAAANFDTRRFSKPKNQKPKMKILSTPLAALLALHTGATLTEDSSELEVTNALAGIAKFKNDFPDLENKITALSRERDHLAGQFEELTKVSDKFKTDLADVTNKVTVLTGERDALAGKLDLSAKNLGRLEKLCELKGIDPAAAVSSEPEPKNAKVMNRADFEKLDPQSRENFFRSGGKLS